MKITKAQLKQLIKEDLQVSEVAQYKGGPEVDLVDAIGMLKEHPFVLKSVVESALKVVEAQEQDPTGTLFHIINRLYEALEKLNDDVSGYVDF